jgi:phenylalanyl-tRNA synthetase alpha chain
MTDLVYLKESYKKTLKTRVTSVIQKGSGWEIQLEKTIFYPQGGGQPSDKGIIEAKNGTAHVKHVRMHQDNLIHECSIEGTIQEGDAVSCTIDWDNRYHNMRVHSAGHIVHEAVMTAAPALEPRKGEHGADPYIEYKGTIPLDKKQVIEYEANSIVQKNLPLTTEFVSLDELQKRSSYVPEHLPKHKPLRILTIEGYQAIPDGGTQVASSAEVGPIRITNIENSSESVRVHYATEDITAHAESPSNEEPIATPNFIGLLLEVQQNAMQAIEQSEKPQAILRIELLGGKSELSSLTKKIRLVAKDDRAQVGAIINQVKQSIEQALGDTAGTSIHTQAPTEAVDITMPGRIPLLGHYHPTTLVIREMNQIFQSMGFSVADGPEIETDEYNYDRVNLPMDHPARDLQDTLYIREPSALLRTQTSSVEAHILETEKPPYRYVIPGKVYRYENANATNNIMFYQYQGLAVATDITMAELKGTLDTFVRKFFGRDRETRFRCKYYPEVEPGVGVDISCAFCNKKGCVVCKKRGWIEMLGAGMIHPNMLRRVGLDPKIYSGFAWGMGLDRIVMQRYNIRDIRSLYNGDIGYKE